MAINSIQQISKISILFIILCFCCSEKSNAQSLDPDSKAAKSLVTLKNDSLRAFAASTEMVYIKGGMYKGKKIEPFYINVNLITVGQYRAAVKAGVCPPPPENDYWSDTWKQENDNLPINNINWYNAKTFANWVGKRLPTEAEWEWVAGGRGQNRIYPWGNSLPKKSDACWQRYNSLDDTGDGPCEVGQYIQSRDGVCDLSGNLWEWTSTFADSNKQLVVLKGGAWYNDNPEKLKVKSRGFATPYHRAASSDGIRLVVSATDIDKVFKIKIK